MPGKTYRNFSGISSRLFWIEQSRNSLPGFPIQPPFIGPSQAVFQRNPRFPAEHRRGLGDEGVISSHVSGAGLAVSAVDLLPDDGFNKFAQRLNRSLGTSRDLKDFPLDRTLERRQQSAGKIFDVNEVSGLKSVPVDHD